MQTAQYTEGNLNSRIAFIGEAPGEHEVGQGRPFVGNAGELLNQIMHSCGIIRSECYLDNVFQFRPPGNDIKPFFDMAKGGLKLSGEYRSARAALHDRLLQSKANVFVPLGNVALHALTGLTGITKRRGSILTAQTGTALDGRKVIPTIHPSAALREYLHRLLIAFDFVRIKTQAAFPEVQLPYRHLMVEPSNIEALQYLEHIKQDVSEVGFDIEVLNRHLSCFALSTSPSECMCIPLIETGCPYFTPSKEALILRALARILEDPRIVKVGQNIIFDKSFMFKRYGMRVNNVEDTMVGCSILFPDYPKGLDFITSIWTLEPYYKDEGKMYMKNPFADDLTFRRYNAKDSTCTQESFAGIKSDLHRTGNWDTYKRQRDIIAPLTFIQEHGILVDRQKMLKAAEEGERKIIDAQARLDELCGEQLNINSPKQMQQYFYIKKKYRPHYHKGSLTCDDNALKKLTAQGSPEARTVQELRHLKKIQSSYFEMEIDPDDRIRSSFNPVGTAQGRISSSKTIFGTGGNMQNLPDDMKAFLIPDPGYIIVQADLSQAENRVVAYIANEVRMIQAFEQKKDVHRLTASLIFNKPIEEISDIKGACIIQNESMSERDWGKRANHGLNYDLGAGKFSAMYEIPIREAEYIIEMYHRAYPGIRQWHASIRDQLHTNRCLTNCFGRTRHFRDRWNDDLFKQAYSFNPQSTVADVMNQRGVIWLYNQKQGAFKHVCLLNTVHDSILFQYPISEGPYALAEVCLTLKANLEQPIYWRDRSFVIPADFAFGFNMKKQDKKKIENPYGLEEIKSHEYSSAAGLVDRISRIYEGGRATSYV